MDWEYEVASQDRVLQKYRKQIKELKTELTKHRLVWFTPSEPVEDGEYLIKNRKGKFMLKSSMEINVPIVYGKKAVSFQIAGPIRVYEPE